MIKVSVIIPLYNTELYIADALDSIINQNVNGIEVIVVDDGSTDNGPLIVEEYCKKYNFIRLIQNRRNKGVSGARNTGILAAKGKYISFLDSDDIYFQGAIFTKVALLDEYPDIDIVTSDFIVLDERGKAQGSPFMQSKEKIFNELLKNKRERDYYIISDPIRFYMKAACLIWTGSVMIRKVRIDAVGLFDETMTHNEDEDFWYQLSSYIPVLFLKAAFSGYRNRFGSATKDSYRRRLGALIFRKKLYAFYLRTTYEKLAQKKLKDEILTFAYHCRAKQYWKKGLMECIEHLKIFPQNLFVWKQLIAILLRRK